MSASVSMGWRGVLCAWMLAAAAGLGGTAAGVATNQSSASQTPTPVLSTAEQVHLLSRQAAARGYVAIIRGVVTCALPNSGAVVIQDATRGIYVDKINHALGATPVVGDLIEVEGVTDPGEFAPQIHARRLTRIRTGKLPEPVHPTWDQLINGSLDSQLVEIQGVVTSVRTDGVILLTHGGKIKIFLAGTNNVTWTQYENALVRLRACLFASWDPNTHQVRLGEIRMFSPAVMVDEPAPADVFAVAAKRVQELLLFDSQASALRRVKVSGQIVHSREGEFYLMDDASGLRLFPRDAVSFDIGDIVEAVGFPNLSGPSPVLREAVVRQIGKAALPAARRLVADNLFQPEYDATRVRLEGVLLGFSADRQTLEMQAGLQRFLARVDGRGNRSFGVASRDRDGREEIPVGSRLQLTGVYSGHGGNRATGEEIGSFELLLNSAADIVVLAKPPFWTLRRLLILIGALATVLVVAAVWIWLLQHKVQVRTIALQAETREREHAQHQRVRAQERARIARDLHDDLGSSLTEITMLASSPRGVELQSEEASERLDTIAGKSRTMVHALDEIVWAVDPQRDTLASVARYLASYAEEYLAGLNVACRVQIPNSFPEEVIPGEVRHHLFLAVKEALNNGVRHAGATEIEFRVSLLDGRLRISISDDGNGFDLSGRSNGHGLLNLRNRLERVSGQCEIESSPGSGTIVSLQLPLPVRKNQL